MHTAFKRLRTCLVTTALGVASGAAAWAGQDLLTVTEEVFNARVVAVEDGDSVTVDESGERRRLHLDGVDAPELAQRFGPEAKAFLDRLVNGKLVTIRLRSRSPRGEESIARLEVNGSDVSAALIRNGMARYCGQHADDRELQRAENDAQATKRGLWSTAASTPPWQYRGVANCWQEKKDA
jgi:endonuclease YncB( thermonuclease family)